MSLKILTIGYAPSNILEEGLIKLHETTSLANTHYVMWHHWPIDEENNLTAYRSLADRYSYALLASPAKNIGLHRGLNFATAQIKDLDWFTGYDPDSRPITHGWDEALFKVQQDARFGWLSLCGWWSDRELAERPHRIEVVNGVRVAICPQPMMVNIASYRMDWINTMGGFSEPNEYYGGLECSMWPWLKQAKLEFGILVDYKEGGPSDTQPHPKYQEWKQAHVFKGYKGNFDQYLLENP